MGAIAGLLLALLGLFAMAPASGQTSDTEYTAALDGLFAELAVAPDPAAAQGISDDIWRLWMEPPDADLAARMASTLDLRWRGDVAGLIATLDAVIAEYPDYAEAYNQRATVNFMLGKYDESLADIAATLEREPRHFGALAGRALILKERGEYEQALETMRAALKIHPFLGERALFPELSEDAIEA